MHSNTFRFKVHGICTAWWNDALGVWVVLSVSVDTGTMHISNMTLQNSKWTNEKKHWILNYIDRELKKVTSGVVISSVLSHNSKNLKQQMDQCYSSILFGKQRKIHPQGVRAGQPKRRKEKRGQRPNSGSSFYMSFLCPLSLPYVNWASQEGCLCHLRFSLWSSDLP